MVSAVRLSRQAVGCRSAGRQRRQCGGGGGGYKGFTGRVSQVEGGWIRCGRGKEGIGVVEGDREGSDVLPVSIIIGGWLTGRRFAPHNSRRPIILPCLPCTNSYITSRHVLPRRYIITCGAILSHTFLGTVAACGPPRPRGFKTLLVKITAICEFQPIHVIVLWLERVQWLPELYWCDRFGGKLLELHNNLENLKIYGD